MAECKALTGSAVKGLNTDYVCINVNVRDRQTSYFHVHTSSMATGFISVDS